MKLQCFIFSLFVICSVFINARAQADCRAYLLANIFDSAGERAASAEVKLESAKPPVRNIGFHIRHEIKADGSHLFAIDYPCNEDFIENIFTLRISAAGFLPLEKKISKLKGGADNTKVVKVRLRKTDIPHSGQTGQAGLRRLPI